MAAQAVHFEFANSFRIVLEFLLQLRDGLSRLLVLLFEHIFDSLKLLLVGVSGQLEILVDIFVSRLLFAANLIFRSLHLLMNVFDGSSRALKIWSSTSGIDGIVQTVATQELGAAAVRQIRSRLETRQIDIVGAECDVLFLL